MKKIIFMTMLAFSVVAWGHPCMAEQTLKVAFGNSMPPWVIQESNEGITLDIIRKSMELSGIKVEPRYYPFARRLIAYSEGEADAVSDINQSLLSSQKNLQGNMSVIAYALENIGVSLKKNDFKFSKISDLMGHSVVAWQGATSVIGGEYADMASKNPLYKETVDQRVQINLLYAGRADVIQLDRQIFKYFKNKVAEEGKLDTNQPIDIFPLFGKAEYGFLFRDKKLQEIFDQNLIKLKESGEYEKIYKKYSGE